MPATSAPPPEPPPGVPLRGATPASQPPYGQASSQPPYGQSESQPPYGQPPYGQSESQPPYGQPTRNPSTYGQGAQPEYPQQQLLPQEVQPGRSRKPLVLVVAVVLTLVVVGAVAWLVLRDDGEQTRAEYCNTLRQLTNDGNLMSAIAAPSADSLSNLNKVIDLAPDAVADDWKRLQDFQSSATSGDLDMSSAVQLLSTFQAIVNDAEDGCGLTIDLGL